MKKFNGCTDTELNQTGIKQEKLQAENLKSVNIGTKQLITNGYFSRNDERLMSVASLLKKSGVNNLLLSVDVFHQEIIPFEPVYSFAKHVKKVGMHGVRLHPAWVVNEAHYNHYNLKTKEILAKFTGLQIPVSNGNNILIIQIMSMYKYKKSCFI